VAFTAQDIRFTTKDQTLYAVCLAWPEEEVVIKSLGANSPIRANKITEIKMLGVPEYLAWSQDESYLRIKTPAERPCDHAYSFKITLQ
jgi:alpha-L-fucosidase